MSEKLSRHSESEQADYLPTLWSQMEGTKRDVRRWIATPNTMPNMEQIFLNATSEGLDYLEELYENMPAFKRTKKVEIDGATVDFPDFSDVIVGPEGGDNYQNYLKTPEDPQAQYFEIMSKIGRKTASIYMEACLDNPLVATLHIERYENESNSDYCCQADIGDEKYGPRLRLIDDSTRFEPSLGELQSRLAGIDYIQNYETQEEQEEIDTIQRAFIAYHEIGHAMDFYTTMLCLQDKNEINGTDFQEAVTTHRKRHAQNDESSGMFPEDVITSIADYTQREFRQILHLHGFEKTKPVTIRSVKAQRDRLYREMPKESYADEYARQAVCVRHRYQYFARNEKERLENPEKRHKPIYGEMIYMGDSANEEDQSKLNDELIRCGIVAGKRIAVRIAAMPNGASIDEKTNKLILPEDYDYHAHQEEQAKMPIVAEGIVEYNPASGEFDLVDEQGNFIVNLKGKFRRQQNEEGKIELICDKGIDEHSIYRLQCLNDDEAEAEKRKIKKIDAKTFDELTGFNGDASRSVLFVCNNGSCRTIFPDGGFSKGTKLIDNTGKEYDMPTEFIIANGIPKAKIMGIYCEVVIGGENELNIIREEIAKNQSKE